MRNHMDLNSRKTSTYIFIAVGIVFLLIILMQNFSLRNPDPLVSKLNQQRELKDLQFKSAPDSPLKEADKASFTSLRYYPVDEMYRVPAVLLPDSVRDTLTLMTTIGENLPLVRMGSPAFDLQGRSHTLTAYKFLEPGKENELFVPFRDLTSGVSTYGGGRYIDMPFSWLVVTGIRDPAAVDEFCCNTIITSRISASFAMWPQKSQERTKNELRLVKKDDSYFSCLFVLFVAIVMLSSAWPFLAVI